jgi:outer membrane protein
MKTYMKLALAAVGIAAASATQASAADLGGSMKDTPEPPAYSRDYGRDWMIRARVLGVIPDESTSNWRNISGDNDVGIDNSVVPELDFTYFFNRNLAVELIAAVTPHEISGKADLAGADIGKAWLLPPTVLLQYHFETERGWKPYVGAGINYTVFFNEKAGDFDTLKLDNSFGWALQAGIDIPIRDNWYFNIDVKKLWLDTEATVNGTIRADVNIDPWIVGVGLGYRFGGPHEVLK